MNIALVAPEKGKIYIMRTFNIVIWLLCLAWMIRVWKLAQQSSRKLICWYP